MEIREAIPSDAEQLAELIMQVEASSNFMLWESGERKILPDTQRKMIENFQQTRNSTILVAEVEHKLIGYLFAIGGNARRKKHSAYLVIGIHRDCRGKRVGSSLFEKLDHWANKQKLHRLELTVITENHAGLSLYKKMGFEIEGIKKDSLCIDGRYLDEYYMAKIL